MMSIITNPIMTQVLVFMVHGGRIIALVPIAAEIGTGPGAADNAVTVAAIIPRRRGARHRQFHRRRAATGLAGGQVGAVRAGADRVKATRDSARGNFF
jgi:hypothetical protein